MGFLSKLLSLGENKQMNSYQKLADKISSYEDDYESISDEELAGLTVEFRKRMDDGETEEDLLPEAFAAVREASKRTLGMRHFDVQMIAAMALNGGHVAEAQTGEGKTLSSTPSGYLNALSGKGVHVVTVNEYLAKRDSQQMGKIYEALGMTVGCVISGMSASQRKAAYDCDITYGTNSEFGFDYLRDNMASRKDVKVQRGHSYAIIDEADSILIDEARTPLIISGAGTKAAETYIKFAKIMPQMTRGVDFTVEEDKKMIACTEEGLLKVERALGIDDLYNDTSGQLPNHLMQSLKAQFLFHKDKDYIVADGEVKIVDEFTGRIMDGRRWSEGLHQAIEAKEGVLVKEENQTLATITLQNYFRLYKKLSGMTGTAMTEDAEFRQIYKMGVVSIPTNKPVVRIDEDDLIYRTLDAKYLAIADEIEERYNEGQPCLIGTISVENSEKLSRILSKRGIKHDVLNAKNHEREASIVAQAGRLGAVTIATNMAGRGTDIVLGGSIEGMKDAFLPVADGEEPMQTQIDEAYEKAKAIFEDERQKVLEAGGLCVIGTERHDSRRIDNQLRGRSGRQGDPGYTQFYISLEDDLMMLFGGNRMAKIGALMEQSHMPDDLPIQAPMVSKAIESAQRQVESMNFEMRKNVLEYDDVMNQQRIAIYKERDEVLEEEDIRDKVCDIINQTLEDNISIFAPEKEVSDDWDYEGLSIWLTDLTGEEISFDKESLTKSVGQELDDSYEDLLSFFESFIMDAYNEKTKSIDPEGLATVERQVMLKIIDTHWMNHLSEMDYLKSGIGLRGYGQRDPLTEYKNEAYTAFGELVDNMYSDYARTILRLKIAPREEEPQVRTDKFAYSAPGTPQGSIRHDMERAKAMAAANSAMLPTPFTEAAKMSGIGKPPIGMASKTVVKDKEDPYVNAGRNDPCPCGSGKKFKKCHGVSL